MTSQFLHTLLLSLLLHQPLPRRFLRLPLLGKLLARQVFGTVLLQRPLRLFRGMLLRKFALAFGLDASAQDFFFIGLPGQLLRWHGSVLGLLRRLHGWRCRLGQDEAGLFAGLARNHFGFQRFLRRLWAWLGPRTATPPQRAACRLWTWWRRQGRRWIAQSKAAPQRRRRLLDRCGSDRGRNGDNRYRRRNGNTGHRRHRHSGGRYGLDGRRRNRHIGRGQSPRRHRRKHDAQGTDRPRPHTRYAELQRQQQRMQQQR